MPIDPAKALAADPVTTELVWDHRDVQLYHLGIGAGVPATDPLELRYTLERGLRVLPGFATVAGGRPALLDGLYAPGVDVEPAAVSHREQSLTLHRPVPVNGRAVRTSRITAVHDRDEDAVVVLRSEVADGDGPMWSCTAGLLVRGGGGLDGGRGAGRIRRPGRGPARAPEREPDLELVRPVQENQALLYRLCGDHNPPHTDPEYVRDAGHGRPPLHALCVYGMALKAAVDAALGGEVERVLGCRARFAGAVFPGETLRVRLWRGEGRLTAAVTAVERDDAPVLADTVVHHA
ncbi:MaoC/PaaZ C-terminal domain-containing protein [Streptomyces sp. TRM 70361]|uniref:MaoC/PaaZ C-terminal domain-containing protein n=1 Tax=Streptomyces sp. TRM 70361 TaxID=3116553 RepID=UPI002E7AB588|nr:MaoC/PaaZ C-terminal domain-containing protein [Streptomyces sp. TRM 70361]MEE1939843.1 MaoC/PaaZ C-terminal domain-containing protein [Streptomyces sp. TRM 70361]